ncbi:hypothetical protein HPP92_009243 [Vanilla planifolia]|uniref:Uncharacterized protein n=1 Tax=Vanilla planifolia TaxID=51239 RepID=A0A835V787_VANPL|nr:hypothetical protein HPP92_009243 [Vanilla planifolia]
MSFSLQVVEFMSVLFTLGSEDAEKELICLGALRRVLDMFFEYPYNNFLHHQVENISVNFLSGKAAYSVCRLGQANNISTRKITSQDWQYRAFDKKTLNGLIGTPVSFVKRNAMENIHNWACGHMCSKEKGPTSLHDRARDSDDEDFPDRDYDVAALASNLSQAFRYNIYGNDDIEDAHGSLERDDEDVYFDDESAEVVISSLRLGDDQDSSLFTNSNWFAFEDERAVNDRSTGSLASPSPNSDDADEVVVGESEDLADKMASLQFSGSKCDDTQEKNSICLGNGPVNEPNETSGNLSPSECEKPLSGLNGGDSRLDQRKWCKYSFQCTQW